jgi:hypothetical protein
MSVWLTLLPMSKLETPMTRWYWQQIKGTLIEEFRAVSRSAQCGQRLLDGVIIQDGAFKISRQSEISVEGQDLIIVQTKAARLGMSLMGQTLFSIELMKPFKPRSIKSVALCSQDDVVLRPLLEKYPEIQVVICPLFPIEVQK